MPSHTYTWTSSNASTSVSSRYGPIEDQWGTVDLQTYERRALLFIAYSKSMKSELKILKCCLNHFTTQSTLTADSAKLSVLRFALTLRSPCWWTDGVGISAVPLSSTIRITWRSECDGIYVCCTQICKTNTGCYLCLCLPFCNSVFSIIPPSLPHLCSSQLPYRLWSSEFAFVDNLEKQAFVQPRILFMRLGRIP